MKRLLGVFLSVLLLCGCSGKNDALSVVMNLRSRLQGANGCCFQTKITADYGDEVYVFTMSCRVDGNGKLTFTVQDPDWIRGITGSIDASGGKLTFDDQVLAFDTLADGLISPVSAPWLMMKTLTGGYIAAAGQDGKDIHTTINDSYSEQALTLDIWLDAASLPKRCEILWQGTRVLSLDVEAFEIV